MVATCRQCWWGVNAMNQLRRRRRFASVVCLIVVLAGCAPAEPAYDYTFEAANADGLYSDSRGHSAEIRLDGDSFEAINLPTVLCSNDVPSSIRSLDWDALSSFSGTWKAFDSPSYSGYLAPSAANCRFLPIYFQRDAAGQQSFIILLSADEDFKEENVIRFVRTQDQG